MPSILNFFFFSTCSVFHPHLEYFDQVPKALRRFLFFLFCFCFLTKLFCTPESRPVGLVGIRVKKETKHLKKEKIKRKIRGESNLKKNTARTRNLNLLCVVRSFHTWAINPNIYAKENGIGNRKRKNLNK